MGRFFIGTRSPFRHPRTAAVIREQWVEILNVMMTSLLVLKLSALFKRDERRSA